MTTWATPPLWANGGLSATNLQTVSSDLTFLKGALDKLTDGTTADTGNAVRLAPRMAAAGNDILRGYVLAETQPMVSIRADGRIDWGPGGATGVDVAQYRNAAGELRMSGKLTVDSTIITNETGKALDLVGGGWMTMKERADVSTANVPLDGAVFYLRDNGSGKTQFCIRYNTGNPIVLSTQV